MCLDPATAMAAGSLAIGAASSISKFGAAKEDAATARAWQNQEAYNAEVARNSEWDQLALRQQQEIDEGTQALVDNQIRAAKAVATADTAAADAGVQGNSVESIARDFYRQQGRIDASTIRNTQMTVNQLQEEKKGSQAKFQSRTNFQPIKEPSMLGLGLEIAGAGLNAYDVYDRRKNGGMTSPKPKA